MKSELFSPEYRENESHQKFVMQNKKLLRVRLEEGRAITAAAGSMVAYQGSLDFKYKGSGGIGKFLKKVVSGENAPLMTVSGTGEVFLANQAQEIYCFSSSLGTLSNTPANLGLTLLL